MKVIWKRYQTQVYPNNRHQTLFRKNCGASRWAFNFALERKKAAFEKMERIPNYIELSRELTKIKGTNALPWAYEVSAYAFQEALRDCDRAFSNFFSRCIKKAPGNKGFPKFKSKHSCKQSFCVKVSVSVKGGYAYLPRIGKVRLSQSDYLPEVKITSATVLKKADKWFVSFLVRETVEELPKLDKIVGIDLGIKTLATLSDGTSFANPKALHRNLRKLKRTQRQLSRKKKGSKNREKQKIKLSRLHLRIGNIRKDAFQKATTKIIRENQAIVLERLNVSGMLKNTRLSRAISDAGFSAFRRMLEYKAGWYGRTIQYADQFYPSSKLCCKCGWKNAALKLSDRIFKCSVCNNEMDRDLNASKNLEQLYTASPAGINASGDGSSDYSETNNFSPSLNEESNISSFPASFVSLEGRTNHPLFEAWKNGKEG